MLDVHPPHHPAHTWKDFFIHVGTICVGLLIAIGLEQTVEYFHHLHQGRHARETILAEIDRNRKELQKHMDYVELHERQLRAGLGVLRRLRAHSLQPNDRLEFARRDEVFGDSAWNTAHETGATAYIPYQDLVLWNDVYFAQKTITSMQIDSKNNLVRAASVLNGETDVNHLTPQQLLSFARNDWKGFDASRPSEGLASLTPDQIGQLERGFQQAIGEDDQLQRWYAHLASLYESLPSENE